MAFADQVSPDDVSDIIFTSGTTGRPKGAMSAHRQSIDAAGEWSGPGGLREGDRQALVNASYHGFGYKCGLLASVVRGVTIHPVPIFRAADVLGLIGVEGISILPGPPTLLQLVGGRFPLQSRDLASLRWSSAGAAMVALELFDRMREELGGPVRGDGVWAHRVQLGAAVSSAGRPRSRQPYGGPRGGGGRGQGRGRHRAGRAVR